MASSISGARTPDYCKIPGIEPAADVNTIRRRPNVLALQYHPDKTSGNADALAKFKIIQEACECLVNPSTRDSYDNSRPFAETDVEAVFDSDDAGEDDDQKIWDNCHVILDGAKGSSSSRSEHDHKPHTPSGHSFTPESTNPPDSQQ